MYKCLVQNESTEFCNKKYRKEYILEDERFILPGNLKRYAEDMLKEMAFPRISYQVSVLDLSAITGLEEDKFYLGDGIG
ncbi:Phage capsid and scaffold [Geobacillus proteiniphilus]|uniref:Phage capsid and scaffold n=1 Tax=Geobacillus proteiniphilus TaxID=860353 RepID=A0A1Q5STT3_9BACL|nr:Phage capsid and scaffold [Geobacillus proteiniphilus]